MKVDEKFESLPDDDVDDVVGIAAEMMQADDETLDRSDVVAVGRELDIPEEYLDRAYSELQRRRDASRRAEQHKAGRLRRLALLGGTGAAGFIFIAIMWGMFTLNGLSKIHARVEAQEGQLENVMERRDSVEARWGDMPDTPDKMAALDGADNRIRVETKRYTEAATTYNARAQRFPATLILHFSSLPERVPTSP